MESSWAHHDNARIPTTVEELLSTVATVTSGGRILRWRGQENAKWPLESSLARALKPSIANLAGRIFQDREFTLLDEARRWPVKEFAGPVTDQEIMCVLQHHGTPTPLLDVTADPHVALWFASRAAGSTDTDGVDGVLFAIEVGTWPELRTDAPSHPTYDDLGHPGGREYRNRAAAGEVFRVIPTRPDSRMIAQRAELLHFANDSTAPETACVTPILVLASVKAELRRVLEDNLGLTHAHLFPDVAGFGLFARDTKLVNP